MIYCPFCDGQGVIYKARIKNSEVYIYICDECDTVWKDERISNDSSLNFEDVMRDFRLQPLWSELIEVEKL
jgi:uncharacterized protein YlaI